MILNEIGFFRDGGIIMYPLLICSLVSLTFVIERAIFWLRRGFARQRKCLDAVFDAVRRGDFGAARGHASGGKDRLLRIVALGLANGSPSLRGTMEMAYAEEEKRINRFMMVLDTIITLAPLLGILGTVLGIIESFDVLGSARGDADPLAVTAGIAKALITTAAGLVIAIFTLIPYNYYRARGETDLAEIEEVATFLEISLAPSARKHSPEQGKALAGRG